MDDLRLPNVDSLDDGLEAHLFALGTRLHWPDTPELSVPLTNDISHRRMRRRFVLVAAAIVLLVLGAALALSGGMRDTVAGMFGVDGLSIEFRPASDTTEFDADPADNLSIGKEVTIEESVGALPFVPRVPSVPGEPDAAFLRLLPGNDPMLSLVYLPSDGIPETAETGVGLLLMEFQSTFNSPQLIKSLVTEFSQVQMVYINGHEAYWLEGVSELTILTDPSAGISEETTRPTANVLIWQEDDITFRLESSLERRDAVDVAKSLVPVELGTIRAVARY